MSLTRRVDDARKGYKKGDAALSADAHSRERIAQAAREEHGAPSHAYLGDLVYGGLDGIITTFAVVSGVAGAQLDNRIVLILGLANLLADGFSMATGAYLSSKSEQEYYEREKEREGWEVDHFPDGERAELEEVYLARGYSPDDAAQMTAIQTRERERWLQAMMVDELGLLPDERKPMVSALATFGAFVVAGALPLLVYLLGLVLEISPAAQFPASLVLSAAALFGLGAAKVYVTERSFLRSGLEMLVVGGLAAAVAYAIGALLKGIGG